MNTRKLSAILLALILALALSATALAEGTENPAAEATAEAVKAPESTEMPADADPIIAVVGDIEIHVSDAMPQYENYYQMMGYYGMDASAYNSYLKPHVLSSLVQQAIEKVKSEELGFGELTEEEEAEATSSAEAAYQELYEYYYQSFSLNGSENAAADTEAYLEHFGYSREKLLELAKQNIRTNKMVEALTADLEITDEDMYAYYEDAVTADQQKYEANLSGYESARTGGSTLILWNPANYRRVRHVLISNEDVRTAYGVLSDELADAQSGAENARTPEEVQASIDTLLEPLYQKAREVREKFDNGTPIDDLIAEYGSDPGMNTEPGLSEGYYVCADSVMWDPAFVEAAMSVDEVGQLSEPVAGQYGLYMVYYLADVTPGAVPYEDVRETLDPQCVENAKREAYYAQLDAWSEELGVQTYIENFVTPYDG